MAFGLGEAIANLFARIAAALNSGTVGSISPLPPTPHTPTPPTATPPGSVVPYPEPPFVGTPPALPPPSPPPEVIVPSNNLFPDQPTQPADCPILSLADRLALQALGDRQSRDITTPSPLYIQPPSESVDMLATTGTGIPVEDVDYFRFRTYGTATGVVVSFFGRVLGHDGVIRPFNHQLTTLVSGTIYTTQPKTGSGLLLGAAASVPLNSISSGGVNAVGEIGRLQAGAFTPHTLLFSGQLDDKAPLSNTNAAPSTPALNPTFKRVTSGGGVGPQITLTVTPSTGKRMRFLFIGVQCTCSAVVNRREAVVLIKSGGNTMLNADPSRWLVENESGFLSACIAGQQTHQGPVVAGDNIGLNAPLPESVYFNTAVSVVAGLATSSAGDIASSLIVNYEET